MFIDVGMCMFMVVSCGWGCESCGWVLILMHVGVDLLVQWLCKWGARCSLVVVCSCD